MTGRTGGSSRGYRKRQRDKFSNNSMDFRLDSMAYNQRYHWARSKHRIILLVPMLLTVMLCKVHKWLDGSKFMELPPMSIRLRFGKTVGETFGVHAKSVTFHIS
jgi:hypothetical protein